MLPPSRSFSSSATFVASAGLFLAVTSRGAGFDAADNVAVYWGQNSYGQSSGPLAQQRLSAYCANTNIDIIPLAFLLQITTGTGKQPVINFANAGGNCTGLFTGTSLLDCPEIGEDIITCQQEYNKTILLSIGGATYTEAGFTSEDVAISAAELVWDTFGPTSAAGGETTTLSRTESATSTITSTLTTTSGTSTSTSTLTTTSTATTATTTSQATTGRSDLLTVSSTPEPTSSPSITTGSEFLSVTTTPEPTSSPTITTLDPTIIPEPSDTETTTENRDPTPSAFPSIPDISQDTSTENRPTPSAFPSIPDISQNTPCPTTFATQNGRPHPYGGPPPGGAGPGSRPVNPGPPPFQIVNADGSSGRGGPHKRQASTILRPFHDAAIDGFDLDLESSVQNFVPFAKRLRELMDSAGDNKQRYLTAAPQCVYPDAAVGPLLADPDIVFDAVFVQFYNNNCGLQSFVDKAATQKTFNFGVWDSWAKSSNTSTTGNQTGSVSTTKNKRASGPNTKVFLGIPAGQTAAGSGYTNIAGLTPIIEYCKTFSSFGGVMMWDASQAVANEGFLAGVKSALEGSGSVTTTSLSSTATVLSSSTGSILDVVTTTSSLSTTSSTSTTTTSSTSTPSSTSISTTTSTTSGVLNVVTTSSTTSISSSTSTTSSLLNVVTTTTSSSAFTSTTATTPPPSFGTKTETISSTILPETGTIAEPSIPYITSTVSASRTTSMTITSFSTATRSSATTLPETGTIAEPGLPPSRMRRNARDFDVKRERRFGFGVVEQEHWVD